MLLRVEGLSVNFGKASIIRGVTFALQESKILALLGPNGSGKSTVLRAIAGTIPARGQIVFDGHELVTTPASERVKNGITLIPQGRRLFPGLTVEENVKLGAYLRTDKAKVTNDLVVWFDYFSTLKEMRTRRVEELSGGQQQLVAIVRGLMSQPRLLLLDEPSLGMSPILVEQIATTIRSLRADFGVTLLLVEQNIPLAEAVADSVIVLNSGQIVLDQDVQGTTEELRTLIGDVYFDDLQATIDTNGIAQSP